MAAIAVWNHKREDRVKTKMARTLRYILIEAPSWSLFARPSIATRVTMFILCWPEAVIVGEYPVLGGLSPRLLEREGVEEVEVAMGRFERAGIGILGIVIATEEDQAAERVRSQVGAGMAVEDKNQKALRRVHKWNCLVRLAPTKESRLSAQSLKYSSTQMHLDYVVCYSRELLWAQ